MPWLDEVDWWCRKAKDYGYGGPMIFLHGTVHLPCRWLEPCEADNDA
jgi:hypothetical protein